MLLSFVVRGLLAKNKADIPLKDLLLKLVVGKCVCIDQFPRRVATITSQPSPGPPLLIHH
jgi:hypothetical protein